MPSCESGGHAAIHARHACYTSTSPWHPPTRAPHLASTPVTTGRNMLNRNDEAGDETGASPAPWAHWTRHWTAEENRHGDALNKYLYLTGRWGRGHRARALLCRGRGAGCGGRVCCCWEGR